MTKGRPLLVLLAIAFGAVGLGSGAAQADSPIDVRGDITDTAGVLGSEAADVQEALDDLTDKTGLQLFVVYVRSFDGQSGADWSDATAQKSGFGKSDILLAVATDDRRYGIAAPQELALSDKALDDVEINDIRPKLSDGDWAGAAIAGAEGYAKASEGSGVPWAAIAVGGAVVVGGGAYAIRRARRKTGSRSGAELDENGQPIDPLAALSTDELSSRASAALVSIDDALKTSDQELGYAEAQFGKEATREFAQTIADSRQKVEMAFGLRQKLDDSEPETEAQIRQMASEIITLCGAADAALDAHVTKFDELRDLQAKAPQVLSDVGARAEEVAARLPQARAVLTQLAAAHPATSLTSVVDNADQAEKLIASARAEAIAGTTALAADDRALAVIHARTAEDAVSQAAKLLDAIDHADADIQAAPARVAARLTSIGLDIADAARLAPGDVGIGAASATAQAAVTYAQQTGADPLAAAADLESAEATLDELLAPVRAAAAEAEKARVALIVSLERAGFRVKAVGDFIETRRGAVGAEARTRLSEAARHLEQARQTAETDPSAALASVQESQSFAARAEQLAQRDVAEWERNQRPPSGPGDGLNSMVLGGILINALGNGGGSFGGRSSGRSSGGSSRGPGSFGGSGTRGRRGGGGRF